MVVPHTADVTGSLPSLTSSTQVFFLQDGCEGERLNFSRGLGCGEVVEIRSAGTEDTARFLAKALFLTYNVSTETTCLYQDMAYLAKR